MLSKTHYAVGLATSLAVTRPDSVKGCLIAVIGGVVGGVVADCDLLHQEKSTGSRTGQLLALGTTLMAFFLDGAFQLGIGRAMVRQPRALLGCLFFLGLWLFGFFSNHRTFTHSVTALLVFSAAVFMIYRPFFPGFAAAYFSHLALDLLNRRKLPLFYPFKFGLCLNLCYADKKANRILMQAGFVLSGLFLLIGLLVSLF